MTTADFVIAIKNRMLSPNHVVIIKENYMNEQNIYIDDCLSGKLFKRSGHVYFFPRINFFDLIDKNTINDFINVTQKLVDSFDNVIDPKNDNKMQCRRLENFGFNLIGETIYHNHISSNLKIMVKENLSIVFKFVKENGLFILVDNFRVSMKNKGLIDFALLGFKENDDLYERLNISVITENKKYKLINEYKEYLPEIIFNMDNIPNFENIVSVVMDYTLMLINHIELPPLIEFKENKERYKNLIEMALIS